MARLICAAVQLITFTGLLCEQSTAKGVDYTVTVTVVGAQEQQVLEIPNIVQLQCTISPTPPFPVVYIWSSSTQNHHLETSLFNTESGVVIFIYERQPSIGHYFCHVLLASNRTTLAVGHITIFLSGILKPIEPINKVFTPPAPLQMGVEIPPMFGHRMLNSLRNITYEWKHNDTMLSDQVVNESSLVITPTSEADAGIYMVKIASFGLPNDTNEACAAIILKHLTSYAIFQGVEFYAYNRLSYASYSTNLNGSGVKHSKLSHTMKEVLFVSGEPLGIDAIIQPQSYHIGVILQFQQVPLRLKLFYNGEQLPTNSHGGIKHPSEASSSFIRPTDELGVPVTFQLPMPTPEDEGLYEMQLFFEFDVSLLIPDCPDYVEFLQAPDNLELNETLIGSLTLMVHEQGQQGRPQVIIETTAQVISVNIIEPPILTCSVMKDSELFTADRIMWKKGGKTLAQTRVSGALVLDTATNNNPTIFGMYTCEAIINQNKSTAKRSILITERAYFKMELVPISTITCLDLSKETKESMLDNLLTELQLSFAYETEDDFTGENLANSSLNCSSEGNSIIMSTDVIYSNSDGSITASALVETAVEWMNGIRMANGAAFQIVSPGSNPVTVNSDESQKGLGSRDIAVIISSILVFGLLAAGIVILAICVQRKYSKKKTIHQRNPLSLERDFIKNNSEITISEAPLQILATSISYDQLVEAQCSSAPEQLLVHREGKPLDSARVVPTAHNETGRARHLANAQGVTADKPIMHSMLSLRPNHAYNKRKDVPDFDSTNEQGQTAATQDDIHQSRASVHFYDYPKVQKDGDTDSLGYQSINNII